MVSHDNLKIFEKLYFSGSSVFYPAGKAEPKPANSLEWQLIKASLTGEPIHWIDGFLIFETWRNDIQKGNYLDLFRTIASRVSRQLKTINIYGFKMVHPRNKEDFWTLQGPVCLESNILNAIQIAQKGRQEICEGRVEDGIRLVLKSYSTWPNAKALTEALICLVALPTNQQEHKSLSELRQFLIDTKMEVVLALAKVIALGVEGWNGLNQNLIEIAAIRWGGLLSDLNVSLCIFEETYHKEIINNTLLNEFIFYANKYREHLNGINQKGSQVDLEMNRKESSLLLSNIVNSDFVREAAEQVTCYYEEIGYLRQYVNMVNESLAMAVHDFVWEFNFPLNEQINIFPAFCEYLRKFIRKDAIKAGLEDIYKVRNENTSQKEAIASLLQDIIAPDDLNTRIKEIIKTHDCNKSTYESDVSDLVKWNDLNRNDNLIYAQLNEIEAISHKILGRIDDLNTKIFKESQDFKLENKLRELESSLVSDAYLITDKVEDLIKNRKYNNIEQLSEVVLLLLKRARQANNVSEAICNGIETKICKVLGLLFIKKERYKSAVEQFQRSLSLDSADNETKVFLAFSMKSIGKYTDALKIYNELTDLQSEHFEVYYNKALTLREMEQHKDAILCFERALELNPNSPCIWMDLAISYESTKQFTKALSSLDKAITLDPNNNIFWFYKGLYYIDLLRHEEAYHSFKKCAQLEPYIEGLNDMHGYASLVTGRFAEACSQLKKATSEEARNWSTWFYYASSLYYVGQYEASIEAADNALKGDSDFYGTWAIKGYSQIELRQINEAICSLEKAISGSDRPGNILLDKLVYCLKSAGKYETAVEHLEHAVSLNTDDADSWYCLGELYFRLRDYQKSLIAMNHVIELAPKHYDAFICKSKALTFHGTSQVSLDTLKEAIEIEPSRIEAYSEIAHKLSVFGRYKQAIPFLRKMIELNPTEAKWYLILAELKSIRKNRFESKGLFTIANNLSPLYFKAGYRVVRYFINRSFFASIYARLLQKAGCILSTRNKSNTPINVFGKLKW